MSRQQEKELANLSYIPVDKGKVSLTMSTNRVGEAKCIKGETNCTQK